MILLGGCIELMEVSSIPPDASQTLSSPPAQSTSVYPWTEENGVMSGFCFESALDAAGQTYILRSSEDHIGFYDLADNSQLCRHPVTRYPFDFGNGRVLAGLWSYGRGCTAHHDVVAYNRDDAARTISIQLRFVTEGTCDYELVRPYWIGLSNAVDYQIEITVSSS